MAVAMTLEQEAEVVRLVFDEGVARDKAAIAAGVTVSQARRVARQERSRRQTAEWRAREVVLLDRAGVLRQVACALPVILTTEIVPPAPIYYAVVAVYPDGAAIALSGDAEGEASEELVGHEELARFFGDELDRIAVLREHDAGPLDQG
jgi:hypothetical protein